MDFVAIVDQVITLLRQRGRVTYRTLQRQFQLDDEAIEDLKFELIDAQYLARDEQGSILVWLGDPGTPPSPPPPSVQHVPQPPTPEVTLLPLASAPAASAPPEAERRQLTVLFCDLVDSARLARRPPGDGREDTPMQSRTVLRRRTLVLALLGGPWLVDAQGPPPVPRLGVLLQGTQRSSPGPALHAFLQRLQELGYREGATLRIDYRFAARQLDRLPTFAAELVALQPDVLCTAGTPAVQAASQATTTIPIVVGAASDLVAQGLVASLAHPGGNITGLTLVDDLSAKRRDMLKEAVPTITRVAHLSNPANPGDALRITADAYRVSDCMKM